MASDKSIGKYYFLLSVLILYIVFAFIDKASAIKSIMFALNIFLKLIPVLFVIFLLLALINFFITKQIVIRWIEGKKGVRKWLIALLAGIISSGPIYMWYPLLKDLSGKGISGGFIAAFIYSRAIKPALIPLMIVYFGIAFTIWFNALIAVIAIAQGLVTDKIYGGKTI